MIALLAAAAAFSIVLFAAGWGVCVRIRNYAFLDALWTLNIGLLAAFYAVCGTGAGVRRAAFAAVGIVWSVRLGSYVLMRVLRAHPAEDARYRSLRESWPGAGGFLLFFEIQALVSVVFSVPFLLASAGPDRRMSALEIAGLAIALGATVGEAIADRQSRAFKRDPRNRSSVLNVGLWRYSRHPNYFFESLVWWGFFIAACDLPYGWCTVICAVMMLYFLLRVTGIPLTEKHSLQSRGAAYREYQRTTSRFIPWRPKRPRGS